MLPCCHAAMLLCAGCGSGTVGTGAGTGSAPTVGPTGMATRRPGGVAAAVTTFLLAQATKALTPSSEQGRAAVRAVAGCHLLAGFPPVRRPLEGAGEFAARKAMLGALLAHPHVLVDVLLRGSDGTTGSPHAVVACAALLRTVASAGFLVDALGDANHVVRGSVSRASVAPAPVPFKVFFAHVTAAVCIRAATPSP